MTVVAEANERIGNTNWRPMSTVPEDGTQVLLGLANGWVVQGSFKRDEYSDRYQWWRGTGNVAVPVETTHVSGSINEKMKAVCWQPVEKVPEEKLWWNDPENPEYGAR